MTQPKTDYQIQKELEEQDGMSLDVYRDLNEMPSDDEQLPEET